MWYRVIFYIDRSVLSRLVTIQHMSQNSMCDLFSPFKTVHSILNSWSTSQNSRSYGLAYNTPIYESKLIDFRGILLENLQWISQHIHTFSCELVPWSLGIYVASVLAQWKEESLGSLIFLENSICRQLQAQVTAINGSRPFRRSQRPNRHPLHSALLLGCEKHQFPTL